MAIQGNLERPCSPGSPPPGLFDPRVARDDGVALDNLFGAYARPQNPPQALERVDSAPGIGSPAQAGFNDRPGSEAASANLILIPGSSPGTSKVAPLKVNVIASAGGFRPINPPQGIENIASAPGIGSAQQAGGDAEPTPNDRPNPDAVPPDLVHINRSYPENWADAPFNANVAARWSLLCDRALRVAPQQADRAFRRLAAAGDDRPKIPAQSLENVQFAPGFAGR